MKALVILNRKAGTGRHRFTAEEIAEAFRRQGIEPDVRVVEGEEIARALSDPGPVDVVVSAGGDGTLLTVATEMIRRGIPLPLGILAMGTVNLLARNAGIPLDPEGVAETIAGGRVLEIDAAEVNGRIFLTDVILGLITHVLFAAERRREGALIRLGVLVSMLFKVLLRFRTMKLDVRQDHRVIRARVPFVIITNNPIEFNGLRFGNRPTLNGGRLCLYLPRTTRRLGLLRIVFLALIDRLDLAREVEIELQESISVHMRKTTEMVFVDGEYLPMDTPLSFRILPRALRICVPPEKEEQERRAPAPERVAGR